MADNEVWDIPEPNAPSQEVPQAAPQGDLRQQWGDFLAKPEAQGMMLQFGLSLLQPYAAGQTAAGHFAQSVGSVGEYVDRNRKSDLEDRKMDLAETVADDKLELGNTRLQLQGERQATAAAQNAHRLTLQRMGIDLRQANLDRLTARDKADLDRRERDLGRKLSRDETWAFFKERGLDLTEAELERKIAADEAREQYRTLSIAQREREIGRRLTEDERRDLRSRLDRESREKQYSLRNSVSRKDKYDAHVEKLVTSAEKSRDNILDPEGQARWKGKTRAQIYEEIRRDPKTRQIFHAEDPDDPLNDPATSPTTAGGPNSPPATPPAGTTPPAPAPNSGTGRPVAAPAAPELGPTGFPVLKPGATPVIGQTYDNGKGVTKTWNGRGWQ